MFAASTYDEIVEQEKMAETKQIVVFIFVKPTNAQAMDIVREFEYIHYNSGEYCSVYAIGYSNNPYKEDKTYKQVEVVCNSEWFFSTKAFVDFKNKLENRINWRYSGEIEVLILQSDTGSKDCLNFQNYVAININEGLRKGYTYSFQMFMESVIRSARTHVRADEAINNVYHQHISIKDVVVDSVDDCKRLPLPIKRIIKDRLFYRSANSFIK